MYVLCVVFLTLVYTSRRPLKTKNVSTLIVAALNQETFRWSNHCRKKNNYRFTHTHTHTHSTNTHTHIEKCNLTYLKEIEEVSSMSIHETKERVSNYNPWYRNGPDAVDTVDRSRGTLVKCHEIIGVRV